MRIGVVAGEASGDLLGASLIQSLQSKCDVQASGVGGPQMIHTGFHSLFQMDRLSVMGLVEPLKRLPELLTIRHKLYKHFIEQKPAVFIGIDSPDFNLGLELKLRCKGLRTVHYVSPSVWAWRKKRVHKIARATDLVLTLFPFETEFYHQHNVPAVCVGHPLADQIPLQSDKLAARKSLNLSADGQYIALLPGSRAGEVENLAPCFIQAALHCLRENPALKFITNAVSPERAKAFQQHCQTLAPKLPITFFTQQSHLTMSAADAVLIASGTATLEAMLYKKPMVIAYKFSKWTYAILRHLIKIPFVGLPNILAKKMLVPEFIQDAAQPAQMATALLDMLSQEKQTQLQQAFLTLHQNLRCNASEQAAQAILKII